MSSRPFRLLVILVGSALLVASVVFGVQQLSPFMLVPIAALVVGSMISWKAPDHPIGWLLLTLAGTVAFAAVIEVFAAGVTDPSALAWLDAVGSSLATIGIMILPFVLLLFPDGSLLTKRWRFVAWIPAAAMLTGGLAALLNSGWGGDQTEITLAVSPLYESTKPIGDILSSMFFPLMALAFIGSAVSLIVRFRRSEGESRMQIKWLTVSGAFVIAAIVLILVGSTEFSVITTWWEEALLALAFASIPIAIGIAVLKYRLYDIDVVINKAVVLGSLAVFITLTYAVIVVWLGQVIGGEGLALPIAATALIAVAFEPVRHVAQRWANRLVYGSRATPYEVLSDLTRRLAQAEEGEGEGILTRLAALLCDGTGAERATVWLGGPAAMEPVSTSPADANVDVMADLDDPSTFTVYHDDEIVGALEVVKPRGTFLSAAEKSLVSDLAGSAGAVLGYQRLNDSLEGRARELEESRTRLLGVQDQERRRLERDLHEGAEQYIVALKVKIGVASQLADKHDAPDLANLLNGLTGEAQAALDDVQSLAKGIYPPILESDGLGPALSALASSAPVDVVVERDGVGRYPAEVEAAVYFDVSEAVTNAVKHAAPPIRIKLSDENGILRFSVVDAGPGFNVDTSDMGSGLENMADRLDSIGGTLKVTSSPGHTTEVSGTIPLVSVPV